MVKTQHISDNTTTLKGDDMLVEWLPEGCMREDLAQGKRAPPRLQLKTMLSLNRRCRWAYPGWPPNDGGLND